MSRRRRFSLLPLALAIAVAFVATCPAGPAWAEETVAPADLFAQGEARLAAGDLEGAASLFTQAARAAPQESSYAAKALLVRRIVTQWNYVATKAPSARWERVLLSVHVFLLDHGLTWKALELEAPAHQRANSGVTAAVLVETRLELGHDAEALVVLEAVREPTMHHVAWRGIALARLGRFDEARALQTAILPGAEATPSLLFDAARFHALLGQAEPALATLRTTFERTAEPAQESLRVRSRTHRDLAVLRQLPTFEEVLRTPSKVSTGSCSGGSDCSSCPNRSGCGNR